MLSIEGYINGVVQWLRLGIETIGVLIIVVGVAVAGFGLVREWIGPGQNGFNAVRLQLARYLALGLEFQLGADILSTAIAPGWDEIGKLAAIATIRTVLNYFLMQEMKHEQAVNEQEIVSGGNAPNNNAPNDNAPNDNALPTTKAD